MLSQKLGRRITNAFLEIRYKITGLKYLFSTCVVVSIVHLYVCMYVCVYVCILGEARSVLEYLRS